eukprot:NODE_447_length_912_cov_223.579214_g439_i0.p1 GENE.NODE_447_length_912_cov_223.579214_g439_i0~~NODE_447_length_912_cov_223.579214_g439_i0.p1  ORF type:complete len:286 (-),score=35.36 NODE_447_length_912_cov_223.579214_g439_i0:55-846(-)
MHKSETIGGDAVQKITDKNFDKLVLGSQDAWLLMVHAPWCLGSLDVFVEFHAAALKLQGVIQVGAVDASLQPSTVRKLGTTKVCDILFYPMGDKDKPQRYPFHSNRDRHDQEDFVEHVFEHLDNKGVVPGNETIHALTTTTLSDCLVGSWLVQIKWCVLFIIDTTDTLPALNDIVHKMRGRPMRYIYTLAGAQRDFEAAVGVEHEAYPAMVAFNQPRAYMSLYNKGTLKGKDVIEHLTALFDGTPGYTTAMPTLPNIEASDEL